MRTAAYTAVLLALCCCLGCTNTGASSTEAVVTRPSGAVAQDPFEIAKSLDLRLADDSSSTPVTLPRELVGPVWGAVQSACLSAGYDLRPYAGKSVVLTKWLFVDPPPDRPSGMTVIEREGRIIGVYTFTEGQAPGISSLGVGQTR